MKPRGFMVVLEGPYVEVWEEAEVVLPLDRVLALGLGSVDYAPWEEPREESRRLHLGPLAVPRASWAAVTSCHGEPVLHWDGRRMRHYDGLDELPADFLDAVDREGRVGADYFLVSLGAPELVARFVVDARDLDRAAATRERRPRPAALARPAFLVGSRACVALEAGADLPVVSEPGEVRHVLARTARRRYYVPTARPGRDGLPRDLAPVLLGVAPRLP